MKLILDLILLGAIVSIALWVFQLAIGVVLTVIGWVISKFYGGDN